MDFNIESESHIAIARVCRLLASCSEKDIVANVAIPEDTAGSHASLYNYTSYGDIYSEYLGEVVCRDAK